MIKILAAFLISLAATLCVTPLVIRMARRLKLRQTVLHYVDNHAAKSGTPTMGGIGFVAVSCAVTLLFARGKLAVMIVLLTLGFGVIGFLDDFIKVYFKQNKGLSPWQKILFQVAVAIIIAFFAYESEFVSDRLYLPFTLRAVRLGVLAVPFYAFVFLAFTNAVNLTDGLDGLAAKSSAAYIVFFGAMIALITFYFGVSAEQESENLGLLVFCVSMLGGTVGFCAYNSYPASVFMGDTGSLALGGALAGLAVMSGLSLIAPIIGVVFVISCVSDIIQVLHYKRTKKRVFKMAPFHHHLERSGLHENKIVSLYLTVTLIVGALTLLLTLAFS